MNSSDVKKTKTDECRLQVQKLLEEMLRAKSYWDRLIHAGQFASAWADGHIKTNQYGAAAGGGLGGKVGL